MGLLIKTSYTDAVHIVQFGHEHVAYQARLISLTLQSLIQTLHAYRHWASVALHTVVSGPVVSSKRQSNSHRLSEVVHTFISPAQTQTCGFLPPQSTRHRRKFVQTFNLVTNTWPTRLGLYH